MHKGINSTVDEGQTPIIALQDVTPREKAQNGKGWNDDGVSYTVDAAATQGVAQPIPIDMRNEGRDPEKHDEMNRQGVGVGEPGDPAHTITSAFVHGVAQPVLSFKAGQSEAAGAVFVTEEFAPTLQAQNNGSTATPAVLTAMQVRRLTPVECERLQGFPDGYTNIKDKCPDGPRYKALGNSWAVPVVRWIGERIDRALD
jgi:DNA (cytosine-5)-methyltransferase 1